MKKIILSTALAASLIIPSMASVAMAHSPIFDCFDNGDGTVTCQGGFSDGSSASGVKVHLHDAAGNVVETLTLDANSEITIDKPADAYALELDAGEGHSIVIDGANIVE